MGNSSHKQSKEITQIENVDTTIGDEFDTMNNPPIDKIWYGTKQKCPIKFYENDKLWDIEFEIYCNNLCNSVLEIYNITLSLQISNIIINQYLQKYIYRRWYPRDYILNSLQKQNSLIPKNFKYSRKSQSIINNIDDDIKNENDIIQKHLIEYFDLNLSLKQLDKNNINENWDKYFKNDDFLLNEIVIYKKGDYFKKHIDTIYEYDDENNTKHKYDYTLIIIAPSNYNGGKLIIYDKNNNKEIIIGNNANHWQWILFPKIREHECSKLLNGIKIVFKFHISSHSFASYDGYDRRYNVAYEPMADDFKPKPLRHKNPFTNHQLWQDSDSI